MQKTPRGFIMQDGDDTTPLLDDADLREPNTERINTTNKRTPKPQRARLPWSRILTPQSNLILLAYASMSLHSVAFDSVFPVFLNHKTQTFEANPAVKLPFKFSGGFGLGTY